MLHATAYTCNAQVYEYTTILIMLKTSSSLSRINRLAKNKWECLYLDRQSTVKNKYIYILYSISYSINFGIY